MDRRMGEAAEIHLSPSLPIHASEDIDCHGNEESQALKLTSCMALRQQLGLRAALLFFWVLGAPPGLWCTYVGHASAAQGMKPQKSFTTSCCLEPGQVSNAGFSGIPTYQRRKH